MSILFVLLTMLLIFASVCLLIIGLINPKWAMFWGKKSRLRVFGYYSLFTFGFFILFIISVVRFGMDESSEISNNTSTKAASAVTNEQQTSNLIQGVNSSPEPVVIEPTTVSPEPTTEIEPTTTVTPEPSAKIEQTTPSVEPEMIEDIKQPSQKREFEFEKQRKSLEKSLLKEYELIYLELENKWLGTDYFKRTLQTYPLEYVYIGETKDSKPHGNGSLFRKSYSDLGVGVYAPLYMGKFEDGYYNGFGMKFNLASNLYNDVFSRLDGLNYDSLDNFGIAYLAYEGYFKKGEYSGKGIERIVNEPIDIEAYFDEKIERYESKYIMKFLEDNKSEIERIETELYAMETPIIIPDIPLLETKLLFYGEFDDNKKNGKGELFRLDGSLIYKGSYKNNSYHGKGVLYFSDGKPEYEGELKHGKYDGKGTLYNYDGTIKYKGTWKSGDIK